MQGQASTVEQFLEQIEHPSQSATEIRKQWRTKSPEEVAEGGRKLLYGVIGPVLRGDEQKLEELKNSPELVAEIEAYFGTVFEKCEQAAMTSGRRSSTSS